MNTRFLLIALLALSACASGEVKETLGLTRDSPDEFVVVSRPPLSVPPEFNLVPPEPGKQDPRHSTETMAKEALLGADAPVATPALSGFGESAMDDFSIEGFNAAAPESAVMPVESMDMGSAATSNFLSKTGAEKADPNIRSKLGKDEREPAPEKEDAKSLYEQMIGAEKAEPVLDAKGEAERIRANKDAGKKINDGDVVTQDEKKKSVLDQIW